MNSIWIGVVMWSLAQAPAEPAPPEAAPPAESAPASEDEASVERALRAAERSADAAEQTAQAVERIARKLEGDAGGSPAVVRAPATEAPSAVDWVGAIGLSLISLTGNSESLTVSTLAAFERKSKDWIVGIRATGAYGQSRPTGEAEQQVVALNALGQARLDRRFTEVLSGYGLLILETDHLKSIEYRSSTEVGAGIVWVDQKGPDDRALFLRTDLALRYANESRYQYYPTPADLEDIMLVAPKVGASFRYALSKDVVFTEDVEVLLNILGPLRVLFTSSSKLSARLVENLALAVGFQITHDSLPAAGKLPTDSALTAGIEVAL